MSVLGPSALGDELPSPFVFLSDVDASIVQDIRYATEQNFTGRKVPGYDAAECILARKAAIALRAANQELGPKGFSLKVFDCYRPSQSVKAFIRWVGLSDKSNQNGPYHPNVERRSLIALGYVAAQSKHSTGYAVDVGLIAPDRQSHPAQQASCLEPNFGKNEDGVDMGTAFDCFDPKSQTGAKGLTDQQRIIRKFLVDIMTKHGFVNYSKEWWHFTYSHTEKVRTFDFRISRR